MDPPPVGLAADGEAFDVRGVGDVQVEVCAVRQTVLEQVFGDPIRGTTMAGTFKDVGFLNPIWYNLGGIGHISQEEIDVYLATLSSRV